MSIDLTKLNNTSFAVLVWYIKDGEEDEAKVYGGLATWNAATSTVDVRRNESEKPVLHLSGEQLERIQIVTDEVKEILLNCDYGISLTMSELPEDNPEGYTETGMKW